MQELLLQHTSELVLHFTCRFCNFPNNRRISSKFMFTAHTLYL